MKYQAKTEIQNFLSEADKLYLELTENDTLSKWRQEMTSGNEAFRKNKPGLALHFFEKATTIVEEMLASSLARDLYPDSALTALSQTKRNSAEIYLRLGQLERAVRLKESFFDQLCDCAQTPHLSSSVRGIHLDGMMAALEDYIHLLDHLDAPLDRMTSAYAKANRIQCEFG
ncbi:MAG: hypothetical protein MI743_14745 [Sneathiellales bacterium]|nr:hypothetical protein [Sneathiellales bacterium]